MITKITQKEFRKIRYQRKNLAQGQKMGFLIFQASDGCYYKTDKSGMQGTKEMTEWQKKINNQMTAQTELL